MRLVLVPLVHDQGVLLQIRPRLEHGAALLARPRPRVRRVHVPRELVPPQDVDVALYERLDDSDLEKCFQLLSFRGQI